MDKATREKVIKWFGRKYDGHLVPLGYDPVADAAKIYGISLKESHECKLASFKRHLGMGRYK
jgi:hypothetical protein